MAKKDKAPKLPKKVGGVKVPKQLRKTAKTAIEIAQNPLAREIVSAAVVAGAAALAKGKTAKGASAAEKPTGQAADKITDLGSLIAQGVAAFVSGFDKGAEMMSENVAPKTKPESTPKTKN
jgi:hypothetical protein